MKVLSNKKGIYEFILTKSVMLIFILGLVGIFYSLYQNIGLDTARDIADAEAKRITKEIDDAIGYRGVHNTISFTLDPNLKVGRDTAPYDMEITNNGVVLIKYTQYPYKDIFGSAQFGINLTLLPSSPSTEIDCNWHEISNLAKITVKKESDYEYHSEDNNLYYVVTVTISSEDCLDTMIFEEEFLEVSGVDPGG